MEVQVIGTQKSQDTRSSLRFCSERRVKVHFVDLKEHAASKGALQRFVQKFSNGDTVAEERSVRMNLDMLNSKGRPDLSAVQGALGQKRIKNEVIELPPDPPTHRNAKSLFDVVFDMQLDSQQ